MYFDPDYSFKLKDRTVVVRLPALEKPCRIRSLFSGNE